MIWGTKTSKHAAVSVRWIFVLRKLGVSKRNVWKREYILLMEEILHQLIGSVSHYLKGFIHPRWCRISSIKSIPSKLEKDSDTSQENSGRKLPKSWKKHSQKIFSTHQYTEFPCVQKISKTSIKLLVKVPNFMLDFLNRPFFNRFWQPKGELLFVSLFVSLFGCLFGCLIAWLVVVRAPRISKPLPSFSEATKNNEKVPDFLVMP